MKDRAGQPQPCYKTRINTIKKTLKKETKERINPTVIQPHVHSENITFTLMALSAIGAILISVVTQNRIVLIWTVFASIVLILLAIAIKWKTKLLWILFCVVSVVTLIGCICWQINIAKQVATKTPVKSSMQLIQNNVVQAQKPLINHNKNKIKPIHSNSYLEVSDQPKLSIRPVNKPYLRYENVENNKIALTYELSISNLGKNDAVNIRYSRILQKLVVSDKVVLNVDSLAGSERQTSKSGYIPPARIISGDRYFQIFGLNGTNLNESQINNVINDYQKDHLAVILDIGIKYNDAITHKEYETTEILKILRNKDEILDKRL